MHTSISCCKYTMYTMHTLYTLYTMYTMYTMYTLYTVLHETRLEEGRATALLSDMGPGDHSADYETK